MSIPLLLASMLVLLASVLGLLVSVMVLLVSLMVFLRQYWGSYASGGVACGSTGITSSFDYFQSLDPLFLSS